MKSLQLKRVLVPVWHLLFHKPAASSVAQTAFWLLDVPVIVPVMIEETVVQTLELLTALVSVVHQYLLQGLLSYLSYVLN